MKKSTQIIILTTLISSCVYAQNDPTQDRWTDSGSNTEITVAGTPASPGAVKITGQALVDNAQNISNERPLVVTISDASTDYLCVENGSELSNRFLATISGHQASTSYTNGMALRLIGSFEPALDITGTSRIGMEFNVRKSSGGGVRGTNGAALTNLALFRWTNYGTNLMQINANGRLGISTTSPEFLLDVDGTIGATNLPYDDGLTRLMAWDQSTGQFKYLNISDLPEPSADDADWYVSLSGTTTTTNIPTSINDDIYTMNHVGIGGAAAHTAVPAGLTNPENIELTVYGNGYATGQWFTSSDRRYKTNIEEVGESAKTILESLNAYSYDFKDNKDLNLSNTKQYGLMAQEVKKVLPEAVMTMKANGNHEIMAISYQMIIPILVEGYKMQLEEVKNQNNRIDYLENQLVIIQSELQKLQATYSKSSLEDAVISSKSNLTVDCYPNPTKGKLTISYRGLKSSSNVSILITDLQGKIIDQHKTESNTPTGEVNFDIDHLSDGTYVYSIVSGHEVLHSKQVVLRK